MAFLKSAKSSSKVICKALGSNLVKIWPNIKKVMEFWKILPKYKQPICISYSKISNAVIDLFTVAKTTFFSFTCSIVEPYFKLYQCEKLMWTRNQ